MVSGYNQRAQWNGTDEIPHPEAAVIANIEVHPNISALDIRPGGCFDGNPGRGNFFVYGATDSERNS